MCVGLVVNMHACPNKNSKLLTQRHKLVGEHVLVTGRLCCLG